MTVLLKQSTSVVVSFGPFVLNSDGVTLVINLVGTGANQTENTSTGIRIAKNGGAFAARHAVATASTYDAFGNYLVTLDTTDTGTVGVLRVQFANSAAFCPVWQDFLVVPANIYDSVIGGTDVLDVSVIQLLGTAWLTPGVAGTPDVNAKQLGGTAQTGRDVGASVLLSTGTGTGQLDFTSGVVKANLAQILGTALTETAGLLAGGFKKFFNISTPAATMDHGVLVDTVTTTTTATTATNLTNAPTAGDFTATMKTSLSAATPVVTVSDKTGFSLSTAGVKAIWDQLTSALTTVGSIGKLLVDNIDAAISSRTKPADTQARVTLVDTVTTLTNAPSDSSGVTTLLTRLSALRAGYLDNLNTFLDSAVSAVKTVVDAIKAKTDNLPASPSAVGSAMTLTSAYDFAKGTVAMAESYNADGSAPTPAQALMVIMQMLTEENISGTTVTIKKLDGSTTALTLTLDSATTPASITRAT